MNGMLFGERLRQLREGKYSQEELAEKLNVHNNTISKWETGKQEPRAQKVAELARLLGTSTAYLLGDTDDPEPSQLTIEDFSKKLNEEGVAQSFKMGSANGMLTLQNGTYTVTVPNDERNSQLFWEAVNKMFDSVAQPRGIDASMNILDGGQGNYHGNVITTK